ncbi:hypothetical protein GCM10019997_11470 [Prevotella corporis]|uniref:hypothetical protein n=1 Tax=Prevotella corporis TaxID=28128 RepID=UPI0004164263|nr:hypothetical protein [Prevotella corporis]
MQRKRIQNKISESRWSLPVIAPLAISIWVMACLTDISVIPSLLCVVFSTYLMMELNNANALIRIYSRIISCTFLLLATMAMYHFVHLRAAIVVLCTVGFYTCSFRCYQDNRSPGWIFYAFLCVGCSSVVWVQTLYFVPLLWLMVGKNLLAMSLRSFVSSLFGIVFPHLVLIGYFIWTNQPERVISHFQSLGQFGQVLDYKILSLNQIITVVWLIVCAAIGTVHCVRQKRSDSIRTRLLYNFLINVDWMAIAFLIVQPQHYEPLLGIITVTTSPIIGHFLALTYTKWSNLTFKVLGLGTIAILLFNLWTSSPIFF